MLKHLLKLLRDRSLVAALSEALDVWHRKPLPELARVVLRIADENHDPSDARPPEELLNEPDPLYLSAVLSWIGKSRHSVEMLKRHEALVAKWPPDPRSTDFIFAFIREPHWNLCDTNPKRLVAFMAKLLAQSPDQRVDQWVQDLSSLFEERKGTRKGQLNHHEIVNIDELFKAEGLIAGKGRNRAMPYVALDPDEASDLELITIELDEIARRREKDESLGTRLLQDVIDNWTT